MTLTRKEWENLKKTAELKRESSRAPYYRALEQAEVAAAQLTQHPAWNWFLQVLSAEKDVAEQALAAIEAKSRLSTDFSFEVLAQVQASRLAWDSRIKALEEVISIPGEIVGDAKKAKERLKALNHAELQGKPGSPAAS